MTIEQIDKVDGMGFDAANGEVVLIISDHLDWKDHNRHFAVLEQKLGSYIDFVQSGQLKDTMSQSVGKSTRIKLVHQHTPPVEAKLILDSISQQLSEMDLAFSYESLPSTY